MFRCSMQDLTLHKMFSADPLCMQKWAAELQGLGRYQQLQQYCRQPTAGCRAAGRLKFLHADKFCSITLHPVPPVHLHRVSGTGKHSPIIAASQLVLEKVPSEGS